MRRMTLAVVAVFGLLLGMGPCFVAPPDDCAAGCAEELATCTRNTAIALEMCLLGGERPRDCFEQAKADGLACEMAAEDCFATCGEDE
jgi:hypothetical protein